MRTKTIVAATLFAGAIATAAFAHGNNMPNNQGMQNGMNPKMMNYQNMHNSTGNQQNMMYMMHNMMHGMMNGSSLQVQKDCLNNQQGMHGQQNMMRGNMNGMMGNNMMNSHMSKFSKMNLNAEQKNKLFTLHKEMANKMQSVMHPNNSNGMLDFVGKNGLDKELFKKTMDERHQTMIDFKINHMDKVLKILTKEQLSQLSQ